jgi:hypothetical protein
MSELVRADEILPSAAVEDQVVAQLEEARASLARARSFSEAKQLADGASAIVQWLRRQQSVSLEIANDARLLGLEAERRMGEFLGPSPARGNPNLIFQAEKLGWLTPKEAGIAATAAHRYRLLATVPVETMRDVAEKATAADEELTRAAMLRVARNGAASVHFSSDSDEWHTPAGVVVCVVEALGAIDLDPCSNWYGPPNVPAARHFTPMEDGLQRQWGGRVYMNPPYGRTIDAWAEKLVTEFQAGRVTQAIALVPARTDTDWFGRLRDFARCFIRGRLQFSGHENSAPFPSCAVYLGDRLERFYLAFRLLGDIFMRVEMDEARLSREPATGPDG